MSELVEPIKDFSSFMSELVEPIKDFSSFMSEFKFVSTIIKGLEKYVYLWYHQCTANQDVQALKQKSNSFFQITPFKLKLETKDLYF